MTRDTLQLITPIEGGRQAAPGSALYAGHVAVPSQVDYGAILAEGSSMNVATTLTRLDKSAIGAIGPQARIDNGELDSAEVEAFAERLFTGEFDEAVGRLGANAAGGTFTLVVADALTTQRYYSPGMNAGEHSSAVYDWLLENANTAENRLIIPRQCIDGRVPAEGYEPSQALIGDHAEDCGAHVQFEAILPFMYKNVDILRQAVEKKGITIDDSIQQMIKANMAGLINSGYVVSGPSLQQAFIDTAGAEVLPKLAATHVEVAARENNKFGTTLNRERARRAYPQRDMDAFNIDAWSFSPSARIIAPEASANDINALTVGMQYYNIATALVLCDESLLVGTTEA